MKQYGFIVLFCLVLLPVLPAMAADNVTAPVAAPVEPVAKEDASPAPENDGTILRVPQNNILSLDEKKAVSQEPGDNEKRKWARPAEQSAAAAPAVVAPAPAQDDGLTNTGEQTP